jgi:HK97 family phage prohead protease
MAEPIHKLLSASMAFDDSTRTVTCICSTETPDRIGDVVVQAGIDLTAYRSNPVVLWGHDSDRPVARASAIGVQDGVLRASAQFPPAGEDADADWVYGKVKNRLVNALSIGFIPKSWEPVDPKSPWDGYRFDTSELLEFSFVSLPMNAEALIVGRSLLAPKTVRALRPPSRRGAEEIGPDWRVDPDTELEIDATDEWDSAGAAGRMFDAGGIDGDAPDHSQIRRGFLIHDATNPELRDSYRLPFADVKDGTLKAVKGGIAAARSGLSQIDVPGAVRDAASSALDAYAFRMDPAGDDADAKTLGDALDTISKGGEALPAADEERLRAAHAAIGAVLDQMTVARQRQEESARRMADVEGRSEATRFPRRTAREVEMLKLRSA